MSYNSSFFQPETSTSSDNWGWENYTHRKPKKVAYSDPAQLPDLMKKYGIDAEYEYIQPLPHNNWEEQVTDLPRYIVVEADKLKLLL